MRTRRPPLAAGLGRTGTVLGGESNRRTDDEAVKEEISQMRGTLDLLQRDGVDARKKLRTAELESYQKDKLLQELLTGSNFAKGVPGEAIDQIRDDVQSGLHIKRRMQDMRQTIEEKEQKLKDMCEVLRSTSLADMEDEVEASKRDAALRRKRWNEANSHGKETECFSKSRELQESAKCLLEDIKDADGFISGTYRQCSDKRPDIRRWSKTMEEHASAMHELEDRHAEIEAQKEKANEALAQLGDIDALEATHKLIGEQRNQRLKEVTAARSLAEGSSQKLIDAASACTVSVADGLFNRGFQPMCDSVVSGKAGPLFRRFRRAIESGRWSGMEVLCAQDSNADWRITVDELVRVMEGLHVQGSDPLAVQVLVQALAAGVSGSSTSSGVVVDSSNQPVVSVVDTVLALALQRSSSARADTLRSVREDRLRRVAAEMVWACRRIKWSENELRSRITGWLSDPCVDLDAAAKDLCMELGLESSVSAAIAEALADGPETGGAKFASMLPSWRCPSPRAQLSVLVRFVHDILIYRNEAMEELSFVLHLEDFVELCFRHFGSHWSREDLEEVALVAETRSAGASAGVVTGGAPPTVDGPRLLRASKPDGIAAQFPELIGRSAYTARWWEDAQAWCQSAAKAHSRGGRLGTPSASGASLGAIAPLDGARHPLVGSQNTGPAPAPALDASVSRSNNDVVPLSVAAVPAPPPAAPAPQVAVPAATPRAMEPVAQPPPPTAPSPPLSSAAGSAAPPFATAATSAPSHHLGMSGVAPPAAPPPTPASPPPSVVAATVVAVGGASVAVVAVETQHAAPGGEPKEEEEYPEEEYDEESFPEDEDEEGEFGGDPAARSHRVEQFTAL